MRSSSGEYYVGLDHVRALAAFLVFIWHFIHVNDGHAYPFPGTFDFIGFSLFTEGHTGVSLFMVLSGYLFAKLTRNKDIDYPKFLMARMVRLMPLLVAVCMMYVVSDAIRKGPDVALATALDFLSGVIFPTLPNGGWSITVEFHFYLIFPLLLLLERRMAFASLAIIVAAFVVRFAVLNIYGAEALKEVAFWTIIGRTDQFVFGVLFARYGTWIARRHGLAAVTLVALLAGYAYFDRIGGYYMNATFPEIWLFNLTLEAAAYGLLITYYDRTFSFRQKGASGLVGRVGEASYSIYMLHPFWVFYMAEGVNTYIVAIDNIYKALFFGFVSFIPVALLGWYSYRWYECFWLRFRRPYMRRRATASGGRGAAFS